MKDFIKWLGVNEKVAKVAVWLLIIMVFLIITNTMLESLGFSYYKITYENLVRIDTNKLINYFSDWCITILNFYSILLLIFSIKRYKNIFKYAILYLILNILVVGIFDRGIAQLFIILFIIIFSYLYSQKNYKYIIYSIISMALNIGIQGITYMYKIRFIDFSSLNNITKNLLSIDYFIIMGIIILVKEIYTKKRGEKNGR